MVEDAIVVVYLVFLMLLVLDLLYLSFFKYLLWKDVRTGNSNAFFFISFDTGELDVLKQFSPLTTEEFGETNIHFLSGANVSLKC